MSRGQDEDARAAGLGYLQSEYQLIGYLSRSAWPLWGVGLLAAGTALGGVSWWGMSSTVQIAIGVVAVLIGTVFFAIAHRLDVRRRAAIEDKRPPELR